MEVEPREEAFEERNLEVKVRSFEYITVCNHEFCDRLSKFDRESMTFFVLKGFREDFAEGVDCLKRGLIYRDLSSMSRVLNKGSA